MDLARRTSSGQGARHVGGGERRACYLVPGAAGLLSAAGSQAPARWGGAARVLVNPPAAG